MGAACAQREFLEWLISNELVSDTQNWLRAVRFPLHFRKVNRWQSFEGSQHT